MRRASLALLLGGLALAGCGSSHAVRTTSTPGPAYRPVTAAAEIRAARDSNAGLFRIFPSRPGSRSCPIPAGGPTSITGTCRTSVAFPITHGRYPEAFVHFRESWGKTHFSSWTLILQTEKVVATQLGGETSPQMRYLTSDSAAHGVDPGRT